MNTNTTNTNTNMMTNFFDGYNRIVKESVERETARKKAELEERAYRLAHGKKNH